MSKCYAGHKQTHTQRIEQSLGKPEKFLFPESGLRYDPQDIVATPTGTLTMVDTAVVLENSGPHMAHFKYSKLRKCIFF